MNAMTETKPSGLDGAGDAKMSKFKAQLEARHEEFAAGLPPHIPVARFMRIILIAVSKNPDLLFADRASLFVSALNAATDGLLCDGREAALVIFNTKKKVKDENGRDKEIWVKAVQYMPMVAGILKKCRNSGELSSIVARVVYAGDRFRNWIDDSGEHIEYEAGDDQDRSVVRRVFAMAKLKDGSLEVEVLTPADIDKIRNVSRSKDKGPWVEWWDQMAIKSAIRRLSKRLPLNTDLDDLIRRDDKLYDMEGAGDAAIATRGNQKALTLSGKLDALAGNTIESDPLPAHDPDTGEILDSNSDAIAPESAAGKPSPVENGAAANLNPAAAPGPTKQPEPTQTAIADREPAAEQGRKASEPSKAPATRPSAEERRKALIADLTAQGDEQAAKGTREFDYWVDNLTGDEMALISAGQLRTWKDAARRASN